MKGLAVVFAALMLAISVYNWYEVRSLRQEINRLEQKVDQASSGGITDQALQRAMELMIQARVAMANTDWTKARGAYETAREQISAAASSAGEKTGPALRWLQDQARDLGAQIKDRTSGR